MIMTKADKEYILTQHLKTIQRISDIKYQKRIWIQGKGPECDDFNETVCFFFDRGSPILENYNAFGITKSQYKLLKKLDNEFDIFCDHHENPEEFIDSPEWEKIRDRAQQVLDAFGYKNK